jgi:hypothetical protein
MGSVNSRSTRHVSQVIPSASKDSRTGCAGKGDIKQSLQRESVYLCRRHKPLVARFLPQLSCAPGEDDGRASLNHEDDGKDQKNTSRAAESRTSSEETIGRCKLGVQTLRETTESIATQSVRRPQSSRLQ